MIETNERTIAMDNISSTQIVYTLTAKCRDCYRCLRVCPVKAIGIDKGQAYVDDKRCIACGTCIRECPQGAKTFRNDIEGAKMLLKSGSRVVASVAPSFAAVFSGWQTGRLPSALRKLGFSYVAQVSEGAYYVAQESLTESSKDSHCRICTACSVVVNYAEKYKTEVLENLIPVVSPMIAQAKILKARYGQDTKVVFIGPCIAKKYEAQRPEFSGLVDFVLTFEELKQWIEAENIDMSICEESDFDSQGPTNASKLFPLPGAMMETAGIDSEPTAPKVLHVSGEDNITNLISSSLEKLNLDIIEPLFCDGGCINGPGIGTDKNVFIRRAELMNYVLSKQENKAVVSEPQVVELSTSFSRENKVEKRVISQSEIMNVLAKTGKSDPANQLNCGACGYKSCKDKAEAVVLGMAQPEMCIPYMRMVAEKRTDKIIETNPNGILILDDNLTIIGMNPAFKQFFLCSDMALGRKVSYLLDASGYEKIAAGTIDRYESIISFNGSQYHQMLYALKPDNQYVGIYIDISAIRIDEKKLARLKENTIKQAKELLDQQVNLAQSMARLLGESTARSEELLWRLRTEYEDDK